MYVNKVYSESIVERIEEWSIKTSLNEDIYIFNDIVMSVLNEGWDFPGRWETDDRRQRASTAF